MIAPGRPWYRVLFTRSAQKDYEGIKDSKLRQGVNRVIDKIKEDPYRFKKLTGSLEGLRSAKTFSFRIIYQIKDKDLYVVIVAIGSRQGIYE